MGIGQMTMGKGTGQEPKGKRLDNKYVPMSKGTGQATKGKRQDNIGSNG